MIHEVKLTDFGEIPISWDIKQINEVTTYVDYRGKTPAKVNSGILLITARNIKMGKIDYDASQEYIPTELYETVMRRGIPKLGDVLITTEAPLGNIASIDNENIALAQRVIKYRGKKDVLDNGYLKYFMLGSIFQNMLDKQSSGSTVKGIKGSVLHKLKLIVPPLPEQQKIAEILSCVDDKIEVIDQQIIQTQELKKGLMQRLLSKGIGHTKFKDSPLGMIPESWEVVELGSLLKNIKGGGTPSKDVAEYWSREIPWATVKDLKKTIINDSIDYISQSGLKNSAANLIPAWTLIISTRMAVGKAVFFTKDVSINQDLKALFPKNNLNKFFLLHWFFANSEYILNLASGSTVKGIRLEVLKALKIILPKIEEQQKIAEILTSADDKLEVLIEKKGHYQELKKGLMQQLLTGKIRVKV